MSIAEPPRTPAIDAALTENGVRNVDATYEVAKTNVSVRSRLLQLLLIVVPAAAVASVGSWIALKNSDGSLDKDRTGADNGDLIVDNPNANTAGSVSALVTGINRDVMANNTMLVSTTVPSSTAPEGAGPPPEEGADSPNSLGNLDQEVVQLLKDKDSMSEEEFESKQKDLLARLAKHPEYNLVAMKLMMAATGVEGVSLSEKHKALLRLLDYAKGFPRENHATANLQRGQGQKNWLRVQQTSIEPTTGNPNPKQLYIVALRNIDYTDVLPGGYIRVAMTDDQEQANKWKAEFDLIDENLEATVAAEPLAVAGVNRNEEE